MLIFYLALFGLAFWKMKFAGKGFFAEESFSRDVTDSIKGIFIWLVFFSHFASYVTYTSRIDTLGHAISHKLGQLIVACFLFYSGYGVCEAIKKKGSGYIKPFPKNRILKTLLNFDMAVVLFLLLALVVGHDYSLKTVLLSLVAWEGVGNSNWYIFVILALYAITWLSFIIIKNNIKLAAALSTALIVALIVFLKLTRWQWWYDTALCYALGMWISIFKDKLLSIVTKNNFTWLGTALGAVAVFAVSYHIRYWDALGMAAILFNPLAFCFMIAILLMKFKVSNKLLALSGRYTFEIYILQRLPMIFFYEIGLAKFNIYLYFVLCVGVTILLAMAFRILTNKVNELLFKKKA